VVSTNRFDIVGMKAYGYEEREKNVFKEIQNDRERD